MSRFGPEPRAFFDLVYRDVAPWDIGGAQPAMAALLDEYPAVGPVLDVGCGSGDLAIDMARRGHTVLGIDFVEAAIAEAERKAGALPDVISSRVSFRVADALRPTSLGTQFGSIVDSGFLHLLDPHETDSYVEELASVLLPSGRLYLHEFAVEFPIANVPRAITRDEVAARFTEERGWRVLALRPAEFLSRVAPPVAATIACIERLA